MSVYEDRDDATSNCDQQHDAINIPTTCEFSENQILPNNFEIPCDESSIFETPKKGETSKIITLGMMFDTMEEARNHYEEYGRQEGFWIYTRSSSKSRSRSDHVTNKLFVCVHYGKCVKGEGPEKTNQMKGLEVTSDVQVDKQKKRVRSTLKGGYKACMRIRHDKYSNRWIVSVFEDDHNHKVVTPIRRMKMKSNKHLPVAVKNLAEAFNRENLQVGKIPLIVGGRDIGFDSRDCYNHLRNVRHRELEGGDAQSVLTYFQKKQAENPQFFYAVQCDENGRASNFLWVDARSRMAYRYFGDVVTFDTTYRTNKYDMPFAPFTGVNHHFQTIQFGCALLQDETETTFIWLFETWLEAMGGHFPVSIITDQDIAMKGAISKVFPNTRHRLCIWHIKKKFGEKLSSVYFKKSEFKIELKKCIWATYRIKDFEDKWDALMVKNDLQNNGWLKELFKIRASWVPVFNRDTFYAGMNTTGRSEGVNAFFDAFVTSQTNLREFVIKYDQGLNQMLKRESDEDFESEHKYRIVDKDQFLLKHAGDIYTRNIFKKFKDEWSKVNMYKVIEDGCEGFSRKFKVKSKFDDDTMEFLVMLNLQTYEGNCECKKFEFFGIICRHLIKVFVRFDIDSIPDHFILPRWKKEANKFRIMDSRDSFGNGGEEQVEAVRLSHMCQESTKLACFAVSSLETYEIFMNGLKELSQKLEVAVSTKSSEDVIVLPTNEVELEKNRCGETSTQILLLDPNVSRTKGRKKEATNAETYQNSKRIKSGIELSNKKQRKCNLCQGLGHDKRTCPLNLQQANKGPSS